MGRGAWRVMAALVAVLCGCGREELAHDGRLSARPGAPVATEASTGLLALGLGDGRDGWVYVPVGYRADRPAPLALMLHGAGGGGRQALALWRPWADAAGVLLVAPDARDVTWDVVHATFGPDVAFIDRALGAVFRRWAVDPTRVAVAGFSDGATYALSLGLTNGDLFGDVVAFSPGFVRYAERVGMPRVWISHGTGDTVLPIDRTSRRLVPGLERLGYTVTYREFDGGHEVPDDVARAALEDFLPPPWGEVP